MFGLGVVFYVQEDDLFVLLGEEEEIIEYVNVSFKINWVINLYFLESIFVGVLDIKISYCFGIFNWGVYEFFGLDNVFICIGGDYGIID